jgi:hypothetical protein
MRRGWGTKLFVACVALPGVAAAQKPFHAESTSSMSLTEKGDERAIEIHNVAYQYSNTRVPGRPPNEELALRVTTHSRDIIGDIPEPGTVTLEAWPLGADLRQKPLYTIKIGGSDAHTIDNALWVVNRGYTDLAMWSVYKLGTGQHLLDTYVEMLRLSITKDVQTPRYVGLEVPPDDAADARLKEPHVVAVLTYASEERVIRELLLTHTNTDRAAELRSYADTERTVSFAELPAKRLRIAFVLGPHGPPVEVTVPLNGDDLDAAGARLPPGMRIGTFQRTR